MNRTISIVILMLVSLQALDSAERLNVLLIMSDDLRDYGGAFTREAVKMPNLDRLRQHGTTFERAYVQYPVCNPSRSSMMAGLRTEQTGIVGNNISLRDKNPDIVTLPQLCKDSGWQSHAFGKLFHLGGDSPESNQAWMDSGKSWQSAQAFEVTELGSKMLEGRNVTAGTLPWCAWGAADGNDDDRPDGQIAAATVAMIEKLGDTRRWVSILWAKHAVAGKSLRTVLEKPDAVVKESAFTLVSRGPKLYGQSLRNSRWRFTRWSDGKTELYDHDHDPEEIHNVAEKHADVVKELTAEILTIGKPKS